MPEKKVKTSAEMRLPKFGVPIEESAPPTSQTMYLKEKPRFIQVSRSLMIQQFTSDWKLGNLLLSLKVFISMVVIRRIFPYKVEKLLNYLTYTVETYFL